MNNDKKEKKIKDKNNYKIDYLKQFKDENGYYDGEDQEAFEGLNKAVKLFNYSFYFSIIIISAVIAVLYFIYI